MGTMSVRNPSFTSGGRFTSCRPGVKLGGRAVHFSSTMRRSQLRRYSTLEASEVLGRREGHVGDYVKGQVDDFEACQGACV